MQLVYYRSYVCLRSAVLHPTNYTRRTQYTTQLLTASILVYSKKRNYEDYKAHRTNIWASREELIAYEDALRLEAEIDDLVNDGRGKDTFIEPGAIGSNVFTSSFGNYAEIRRIDEDTKSIRHRLVQQKFETIYQVWKQLIKEPWKDRGGLERLEYGMAPARSPCHLSLTTGCQAMSGLGLCARLGILSDLWESMNTSWKSSKIY